eukprot:9151744-Pyramimonas_sp.AAC.1
MASATGHHLTERYPHWRGLSPTGQFAPPIWGVRYSGCFLRVSRGISQGGVVERWGFAAFAQGGWG